MALCAQRSSAIHGDQKLLVGIGPAHAVFEELHRFDGIHVRKVLPQDPDALQQFLVHQQVFSACARGQDVDGRVDAAVGDAAVELQFHIACSLELLEDDLVHLGSGFRQCRSNDAQRATVLDVAGRTKEALGLLQCVGFHTP